MYHVLPGGDSAVAEFWGGTGIDQPCRAAYRQKSVLLGQAHALQEVGVAGIGTQRIKKGIRLDVWQKAALFRVGFFQPAKRTIFFSQMGIVSSNNCRVNVT